MKAFGNNEGAISRRSLLASMGVGGVALATNPHMPSPSPHPPHRHGAPAAPSNWEHFHLGTWTHYDSGFPCLDADLEWYPKLYLTLCHILSISALFAPANAAFGVAASKCP